MVGVFLLSENPLQETFFRTINALRLLRRFLLWLEELLQGMGSSQDHRLICCRCSANFYLVPVDHGRKRLLLLTLMLMPRSVEHFGN